MISVVERVFIVGKQHPNKIALINGKDSKTYGELLNDILIARNILSEKYGIKEGDRVILAADKQLEFIFVYFACHLLNAVVLPISPDTNFKRYEIIKKEAVPKLIVGLDDKDNTIMSVALKVFTGGDDLRGNNEVFFPSLDSIADIIFTTGTTGKPKGVLLSHRNITVSAHNINAFIKNEQTDVEMLVLPLSHSFGIGRLRCALSNGQTLVLLGGFANVKRFFRFVREYGVNGFGMVPASWALLRELSGEEIEKYNTQLHYIEIGSAPMPIVEKQYLIRALPTTRICMHYGLTEASRCTFMEFHEEESHLDSIGRQSPNTTITIRDENGNELSAGEEGEICVSGDSVTVGYLNLPKKDSFWNESFRTGDWGTRGPDGYIFLKSRKKELINVGGKKVSPLEVEEVLKGLSFIDDCACVGAPDQGGILGEVVKAFVVTRQPEKISYEIIDPLIGNQLEGFKHPMLYSVIKEIPKTSSGKIKRLSLNDVEV